MVHAHPHLNQYAFANNNLFLTSSDGKIIVIELITGKIVEFQNISKGIISKPFVYNGNLFVIKNGTINQYR